MQKLLTFFNKNMSINAILNGQSFKDTLTNGIVSFEQLGPIFFFLNLYAVTFYFSNFIFCQYTLYN